VGVHADGEVELHVPLLLAVFALDPASGLLHLDAGGIQRDSDWLVGLAEALVGVDG